MKFKIYFVILICVFISCSFEKIPKNNVYNEYLFVAKTKNYENTALNSNIINDINLVMKNHKLPYSIVIAADCSTGEIIAINEFSERGYKGGRYINNSLVASSLYKIIPLAIIIGKGIYKPDNKIQFYGNTYTDLSDYLYLRKNKKLKNSMSIKYAIAKSINPIFAEIGLKLETHDIYKYSEKFLFNNKIINGIQFGYIDSIYSNKDKIELCSGLKHSYISPFHALTIAIALGNNGKAILPKINIEDKNIKKQVISKTTNNYILNTMSKTTTIGTSAKIFMQDKNIAKRTYAKTGSLYGKNPNGFYNWFLGIYKGKNTNYAIIALVVNDPTWDIKASYLGFKTIQFIRKYIEN